MLAQYKLSPMIINFSGLTEIENDKKATEWFEQLIPFIGLHNSPKNYVEVDDPEGNICGIGRRYKHVYVPYSSSYAGADMMNLINEKWHSAFDCYEDYQRDMTSLEMYLCKRPEDILRNKLEDEKHRSDESKRIKELIENMSKIDCIKMSIYSDFKPSIIFPIAESIHIQNQLEELEENDTLFIQKVKMTQQEIDELPEFEGF
jgi:hypothetical protein